MAESKVIESKACSKCKAVQPLEAFYPVFEKYRTHSSRCRVCTMAATSNWRRTEEGALRRRTWGRERYQNCERVRKKNYECALKRKYNITLFEFDLMLVEQQGCCAICDEPLIRKKEPHIDHCHRTGTVRGLLCFNCNTLLGSAKDSIRVLRAAEKYLVGK